MATSDRTSSSPNSPVSPSTVNNFYGDNNSVHVTNNNNTTPSRVTSDPIRSEKEELKEKFDVAFAKIPEFMDKHVLKKYIAGGNNLTEEGMRWKNQWTDTLNYVRSFVL